MGRQTYEPSGRRPVHLKNLSPCPLSEANITRRRQAATTLGAKPRQPTPLNPLNLLNPLNPHTAGVSIVSIV